MADGGFAAQVRRWLVTEMQCDPTLASPETVARLCQNSGSARVWQQLLGRVRSKQTARSVRLGVQVWRREQQGDAKSRQELVRQRNELRTKRNETLELLAAAETDLGVLQHQLAQSDETIRARREKRSGISIHSALLQAYHRKNQATLDLLDECELQLATHHREEIREKSDTLYASEADGRLESGTKRAMRDVLDDMTHIYLQKLDISIPGYTKQIPSQEAVWKRLQDLFKTAPPAELSEALQSLSEDNTAEVKDCTARIDLQRDANALRFVYDSNGAYHSRPDGSNSLSTVRDLLQSQQRQHIKLFTKIQETMRTLQRQNAILEQLQRDLRSLLISRYSMDDDLLALISEYCASKCQTLALIFANEAAASEMKRLGEFEAQRGAELDRLRAKHEKIQRFRAIQKEKQTLIQELVKSNASGKRKTASAQKDIAGYHEQNVDHATGALVSSTDALKGGVRREASMLLQTPLERLLKSHLQGLAAQVASPHKALTSFFCRSRVVEDLGIHRRMLLSSSVLRPLTLGPEFRPFHAAECLLSTFLGLKRKCEALQAERTLLYERSRQLASPDQSTTLALLHRGREQDVVQRECDVPVVEKYVRVAETCLQDVSRGERLLAEWKTCPALDAVSFVSVHGKTIKEWRKAMHAVAAEIQKLRVLL
eukprot:m.144904 g.144904  ORF g.144904 m.144904 type:complete len:658 (-) comp10072_c0_seq5:96-2069(-)